MTRRKKSAAFLFTMLVSAFLWLGMVDISDVMAADTKITATVEKNFTVNVGDTLVIPVKVSSAEDMRGLKGDLKGQYDETVLSFENAEYTDGIPSGMSSVSGGNFGFATGSRFKSGTVQLTFKVLKCAASPVTVTIKDLYATVEKSGELVSTDRITLTTQVTVQHPAEKKETTVTRKATCTAKGEMTVRCTLCGTDLGTKEIPATGHIKGQWTVTKTATCTENGTRTLLCSVCGQPIRTEAIPATGHTYGAWQTTREPDVLNRGIRTRSCAKCGYKEQQTTEKLAPAGKLSITKFPLKVKQKVTVSVTHMVAGDYVVNWTSSDKKTATVSGTGKVTGKKKGKATITATLASGLKLSTTVTVQKGTVKTKSITVNSKNVTLQAKQKYLIRSTVSPLTSQQKLTYTTSAKKIVKVDKKGQITALKKGKATITVKSGSKKVKIKVTVK